MERERDLYYSEEMENLMVQLSKRERRLAELPVYKTGSEAMEAVGYLESLGFVRCLGGKVIMGAKSGLACSIEGNRVNETPVRTIYGIESFYIRKTTITNKEYEEFDPRHSRTNTSKGDRNPVTCITYGRAVSYALWLNEKTGMHFSLPTEPQLCKTLAPEGWQYPYQQDGKPVRKGQNVYLSFPELYPPGEVGATLEVDDPRVPVNYLGLYHAAGNVSVFTLGHYRTEGHWGSTSDGSYVVVMGGNFRLCPYSTRVVTRGIIDVTGVSDTVGIRLVHPDPLNYVKK